MKIYCFGNEFLDYDSLAKELADEISLPGIEFIRCNSPEDIFLEEKHIIILDVVEGIDKTILITDPDQLKDNNIVSLHDFDLGFFLKLMKETKQINKISIIGIPMKGDKQEIKKEIIDNIKNIQKKPWLN